MTSILTASLATLLLHPVHETVCEVEWNAQTNRMEVALRLDVLDEQWIEKQWIERTIDKDVEAGWQEEFLRTRLWFDPQSARVKESGSSGSGQKWTGRPIKWVGRKEDGAHVWWFFEVVCDDGKPPQTVRSELLFDRQRNYQHRIVVLGKALAEDGKRPAVLLTAEKPQARVPVLGDAGSSLAD